jgi:hypothetical protein
MLRLLSDETFNGEVVRGLVVSDRMPIGQAIDELLLIAGCSLPD